MDKQDLIEQLRLNNIARVRLRVTSLLLARYRVLSRAEAYQMGQGDIGTAYEQFHVFPSYDKGNPQPLVEWLRCHKDLGWLPSSGCFDFLIEVSQGKRPRTRGPKESTDIEQRDLGLALRVAVYMWLDNLPHEKAYPKVAEDAEMSEHMVKHAYTRFARHFSQRTSTRLKA